VVFTAFDPNKAEAGKIESLQHLLSQLQEMIFVARSEKSRMLYPDHPALFDVPASEEGQAIDAEDLSERAEHIRGKFAEELEYAAATACARKTASCASENSSTAAR
jgi:hypothetical protein